MPFITALRESKIWGLPSIKKMNTEKAITIVVVNMPKVFKLP